MSEVNEKFDKMHINLWGPHYLLCLSEKIYAIILSDAKILKLWVLYLQFLNKFIDTSTSTWLSVIVN